MPEPDWSRSSRWLTAVAFDPAQLGLTREDVRLELLEHGIETRPTWKPMHTQPLFDGARYHGAGFDAWLFEHGLCLPSDSALTEEEQGEVIDRIVAMLDRASTSLSRAGAPG